jgi:hypothetical protein
LSMFNRSHFSLILESALPQVALRGQRYLRYG